MTDNPIKQSLLARLRWWLYARCFAYCVRMADPDATPDEFCLLDRTAFVALSRDEARELMEEAPDSAWRLESLLEHG
jgi:hypothetical protein